jgi:hypothetical protein
MLIPCIVDWEDRGNVGRIKEISGTVQKTDAACLWHVICPVSEAGEVSGAA